MSTASVRDRRSRASNRHRPALLVAGVVAVAASALATGPVASAARAPLPLDGPGTVAGPVVLTAAALDSTRSALAALSNHADVHIDQILKNLATGAMQ